ncbi:uncharacterized protein LOC111037289 isoform X1 [Myzus persicae]|uniref:uncharacterized protein LOC111037289 isoform X1 n=1 Tax=Myzus persicae TaxID=13164 RepID=UPI000B934FCE|nr:uncharacterized protein LOC111037289 isoform X1 [Myzus persicae]
MSSDVSRRFSSAVGGGGGGGGGCKKMRKRKELDALTGCTVVGVNRNRRLMTCSSDSDSCSSSRAPPTPIKLRRQITRRRKRTFVADTWCSALRMFLTFGCVVWVVFETYTFLDVRKIQAHLQSQLDEVAAGNRGVPDDLQKCHAMSKQLQQNQTDINQRLTVYDGQITNLTLQVANLGSRLSLVEKKINENTDLLSNPDATKDPSIKVLSSEVAKLGSTYQDLSGSVKSLKDTTSSLQSYQTTLKANITSISEKLNNVGSIKTDETMINNVSGKLHELIENLGLNVTTLNRTLTSRIDWLSGDQKTNGAEIEKLKEDSQKLNAQVKTIDTKLTTSFNEVNSKVISLRTQIDKIATNVTSLHAQSNSDDSLTSSGQLKGDKNGTQTKS